MILPAVAFLLFDEPDMSVTDSAPLIFSVADPDSGKALADIEFCTDSVVHVAMDFSDRGHQPIINFTLADAAAQKLAEVTTRYVGFEASLVIDGRVISSPRINEPITGGMMQVTGGDTINDAEQIVQAARGHCTLPKAKDK